MERVEQRIDRSMVVALAKRLGNHFFDDAIVLGAAFQAGSLECFGRDHCHRRCNRDLRLGNDPVPEFITAPADIAQTPDGDQLVVSTKANNTLDGKALMP